ncbi:MAG: hypothetical protein WD739_11055 [Actinomycetota bacterium]
MKASLLTHPAFKARFSFAIMVALMGAVMACGEAETSPRADGSSPSPEYYVNGARPSENADSDTLEGCVLWSEDRPVHVCGDIPLADQSRAPAPLPGGPEEYPEVCAAALEAFHEWTPKLKTGNDLSSTPEVDPDSCAAMGLGFEDEGRWRVKFGIVNEEEVDPYRSVIVWNLDLAKGTAQGVSLSGEAWPSE